MSNNSTTTSSSGLGLPGVVFVVFLILKLIGVISWSWWWVFSPLLIGWGLGLVVLLILAIVAIPRSKR